MESTHALGRPHQALALSPDLKWVAGALVIVAITFNALLCFVNTHATPIHNSYVVGFELFIITTTLFACYWAIEPRYAPFITASITSIILYTVLLALMRSAVSPDQGANFKIVRDFLIPVIFLQLGRGLNNIRAADAIVYIATLIILFFSFFEYFFMDTYLRVFDVTEYYLARGTLDELWLPDQSIQFANGLMVSGIRPPEQGRSLLPFLGDRRVSSLLLEPVGLGNFGYLVALWGIVRSRMERQLRVWSITAGIALIILSDSRFNAAFFVGGVLILLISPRVTTPVAFATPFVIILGLLLAAANADPRGLAEGGLSIHDRLLYSGRVLLDFDIYNWLGIEAYRADTFDAGYAYVISNVGLLGFVAFWFWFISLGGRSPYFYAFRNMSVAYFAALLSISSSQFTIKTAALLWFLMGALSVARHSQHEAFQGSLRHI